MLASRANVDQEEERDSLVAGERLVNRAPLARLEQLALEVTRVSEVSLAQLVRKAHRVTLVIQGSLDSRDRSDHQVELDKVVFKDREVHLVKLDP